MKKRHNRYGKWLLALAMCWQLLLVGMPVAMAETSQGSWESLCSFSGMTKVWVDTDQDADDAISMSDDCRVCSLSQHLIINTLDVFEVDKHLIGHDVFTFNDINLNRSWSDQARGPPQQL